MERVLRCSLFKSFVLIICLLGIAQTGFSISVIIPSDDDMIISARAIVTGGVVSMGTAYDEKQERVYTYVTLRVQDVLKGDIKEQEIVIKQEGGQFGDRGEIIYGSPEFNVGERVLLYLETWPDGSLRVHQYFLGKFTILTDPATGTETVVRSSGDDRIITEPRYVGGTHKSGDSTDQMEFYAYMDMVRARLAANQARSDQFQDTYYRNAAMYARPLEYDVEMSRGGILPSFTTISTANPRWFEPDSGQPVTFLVNPAGAPNATINDDITAAMGAWTHVNGSPLQVVIGGSTGACTPSSGLNTMIFNGCDGRWSPSTGCQSTLALGGLSWTGTTITINGTVFHRATAGFVSFNPYASCSFSNHCNVREVTTHELGHALGMGHSQTSPPTMYAIAHFDGRCASIKQDDMDGITFLYPGTGGGGGNPLSITTTSLLSGTPGVAYSQTLVATGGTTPYSWSLAPGSGSLPPGLSLSSLGVISGTPNTEGTYNFTVRVTDNASATADKALSIDVVAAVQPNSLFLSQTVPSTVQAGQSFTVTLNWFNSGTETWTNGAGFKVSSQNPANNITWGGNTVSLSGFTIAPGQQLNLTFTAFAPSTAGTYNFQWQLYKTGLGYFGQASTNVAIQVTSASGTNGASFVSQSVSSSMTAGQTYSVSVTMLNSGTTTWTAANSYKLGSQNPQDNTTWGFNRVSLPSSVAPGSQVTFNFTVTAPSSAGTYNFQWKMIQEGTAYFGSASTNVAVSVVSGGGGGPNNAQYMSQSVPTTMMPGQSYTVTVTMKNTGTSSWTSSGGYKLGSQNPQDNLTWSLNRVTLLKSVSSGSQSAFRFTVRAPATPGTYNFQWQMLKEGTGYFGDLSQTVAIQVGSGGGGGGTNGASFVSQSVVSTMTAGQTYNVSVTMLNSGTTTWTAANSYKLGSQNPQDNTTWGFNRVSLPSSVAPGSQVTFNFTVTAPSTVSTYNFQWQMIQEGTGYFGMASANVVVGVISSGGGGGGTNGASFVSQSVSSSMTAGQTYSVSVTMLNSGTTTWTAANSYKLGSQNPQDNTTWGFNRVSLPSSVAPGSQVTFNFTVTAPSSAGTYNFQWKMIQEGTAYFGSASTNVSVSVASGGGGGTLTITTSQLVTVHRNIAFSLTLAAQGGTSPYTWSILSGVLPPGLTLNSSTGVISGVSSATGKYVVSIKVTDQTGATANRTFTFTMST